MPEQYVGTKFVTVFARREPPADKRIGELVDWCRRLAKRGVVGDTVGNLSFRSANGFIINRTAGDLRSITRVEFVEVLTADIGSRQLTVAGAYEPSSESLMHAGLYRARPEINAVFHGHSERLLAQAGRCDLPVTRIEKPYGTTELVEEVLSTIDGHNLLVIRNHGFVSLGRTMHEAGTRVEETLARL
jgi:ribulose-5-phosphate 4-epimerase/fuculose-1-phosphate aldolase